MFSSSPGQIPAFLSQLGCPSPDSGRAGTLYKAQEIGIMFSYPGIERGVQLVPVVDSETSGWQDWPWPDSGRKHVFVLVALS